MKKRGLRRKRETHTHKHKPQGDRERHREADSERHRQGERKTDAGSSSDINRRRLGAQNKEEVGRRLILFFVK